MKNYLQYIKALVSPGYMQKLLRRRIAQYQYRENNVQIGLDCVIKDSHLGRNVFIGEKCSVFNSTILDRSYLNSMTSILNAHIGKYCSIGSNVNIGFANHPTNFVSTHPVFYSNNKGFETFADRMYFEEKFSVTIGNDVWIGSHSKILGNIEISDGAVIAMGAVVTKNVPPYAIVAGIPARIMKFRFDPEIIGFLLKLQWWNKDEKELRSEYKKFHNINEFIEYFNFKTV